MILGLDISTSCVGTALFTLEGQLIKASHFSPKVKTKELTNPQQGLIEKADSFRDFLIDNYSKHDITEIIIEEAIVGATKNVNTVATLVGFNSIISYIASKSFDIFPKYISSGEARQYGLPETNGYRTNPKGKVAKNKSRFGALPLKIGDEKLNKKAVVLHQIALRYPQIKWNLNRNMSLAVENYDTADAICTVLGYMQKEGRWQNNPQTIEKLIPFVTHLVAYTSLSRTLKQQKKEGQISQDEINDLRKTYIMESFGIQRYINLI